MLRIEDRIKSLEVSGEVTKGRIKKMFDFGCEVEERLCAEDEKIVELQKTVNELVRKLDIEVDKLIRLESLVDNLKKQAHEHRITM